MLIRLAPIHQFRVRDFGELASAIPTFRGGNDGAVLWVTCSDIGWSLDRTSGSGGGSYVVQNLGNTVPGLREQDASTLASLWFGLLNYDVRHLVMCGHVSCQVLRDVVDRTRSSLSPDVERSFWPLMRTLRRHYAGLDPFAALEAAVQENVLLQLENLLTHELVRERLDESRIKLHGWIIDDRSNAVTFFNPRSGQFEAVAEGISA